MWVIPFNLPVSSAFAPESWVSKEDWSGPSAPSELPLTWKGKRFWSKTCLRVWKRVFWIQHLSGRMLRPSMHDHFSEKYTALLEDIPVSLSPMRDTEKGPKILDTFGRLLRPSFEQLDLFGDGLKTLPDTLRWDSTRYTEIYRQWATTLRQEYMQRKKLAHHIEGNDYLSSQSWPTPVVPNGGRTLPAGTNIEKTNYSMKGRKLQVALHNAVQFWQTPKTTSGDYTQDHGDPQKKRMTLSGQAKWPTPHTNCATGAGGDTRQGGMNIQTAVAKYLMQMKEPQDSLRLAEGWPKAGRPASHGIQRIRTEGEQEPDIRIKEEIPWCNGRRTYWPARPGEPQFEWEEARTIEPRMGSTINGYNFREDLLRALGNSVVEQQAEFAFIDLMNKHCLHIK